MSTMSRSFVEEVVFRAGMQVCGGNWSLLPHADPVSGEVVGNTAWAGRGLGLFTVDSSSPKSVDLEAIALRDVITSAVVLHDDSAATHFSIGGCDFDSQGVDMTMVFVPRGERFRFATQARRGLTAVTAVVDLSSMMKACGVKPTALPRSLLDTLRKGETAMDKLIPGRFGMIAADIIAHRDLFPGAASLYYEAKTLELISALLNQLSQRDAMRAGNRMRQLAPCEGLERVKKIIDQTPQRELDVEAWHASPP